MNDTDFLYGLSTAIDHDLNESGQVVLEGWQGRFVAQRLKDIAKKLDGPRWAVEIVEDVEDADGWDK